MPDVQPVEPPRENPESDAPAAAGEMETPGVERHSGVRPEAVKLFRAEALDAYHRGSTDEGHLLEIEPVWMRRAYAVILALLAAVVVFGVLVWRLHV